MHAIELYACDITLRIFSLAPTVLWEGIGRGILLILSLYRGGETDFGIFHAIYSSLFSILSHCFLIFDRKIFYFIVLFFLFA
jgi:hypothetical protein